MRRPRRTAATILSFALTLTTLPGGSGIAAPQDPPPGKGFTSSAEVTLVEVPVHVLGKDGYPLRNLKKEDFEVFDDGDRVELQDVDKIDLESFTGSPGKPAENPPDRPLPPAARRYFLMLFDLSFSSPVKLSRARDAARHFVLNGMKGGDVAAIATMDAEKGMKLLLSFTADKDQLSSAVGMLDLPTALKPTADPLALVIDLGQSGGPNGRNADGAAAGDTEWAETLQQMAALSRKSFDSYTQGRITATLQSFEDLARSMNSVRGRKHILYYSEGFDSRQIIGRQAPGSGIEEGDQVLHGETWKIDNDVRFGNTGLQTKFANLMAFFKKTDCNIYSIDISGLTERNADARSVRSGDSGPADQEGGSGRGQESLFLLAHETGGELLKNSNDIASQLEKLQQQTSVTYLLVFAPKKLAVPGKYHPLKVKVKAPGARVSARTGYFEPRPYSKLTAMERRLATAQLIAWGLPRTDVVARVLAMPFRQKGKEKAEVPVIIEVPGDRLLVNHLGDAMTVELYAYVTDSNLKVRDFFTQNVTLDLKKLRGSLESGGIKYYGTMNLAPGSYWLKVLARNSETGRTGLQVVPITVPDSDRAEPFVLPPLFHETPGRWIMVKDSRKGPDVPYPFVARGTSYIPSALPAVHRGENAPLSIVLYNVPESVPLELEGRIKGTNGKDFGPAALVRSGEDEAGPQGSRRVLCSFRPEGLEKGVYSLLVTGRNRQNGFEGQSAIAIEVQ